MLYLTTPTPQARKDAFTALRNKGVTVLSQYGNTALEVSVTDEQSKWLPDLGLFSQQFEGPVSNDIITSFSGEGRQIAETWNLTNNGSGAATRGATKDDSKRGLSWVTDQFDNPRPHTDLYKDFFLKILNENGDSQLRSFKKEKIQFTKSGVQQSFSGIQNQLLQQVKDPTKVYHLLRLAIIHPELEETILNLPENVVNELFKANRTERSNLGVAMAGAAAPEASCWRTNGEISVGVELLPATTKQLVTFIALSVWLLLLSTLNYFCQHYLGTLYKT